MAVGTTSDFDVTRNELIRASLRSLGVTEPSNQEILDAAQVLNMLVRHLDERGEHLWAISNTMSTFTLVANQQAYVTGVGANNIRANILELVYCGLIIGTEHCELDILDKRTSLRTRLRSDSNAQPIAVHLESGKLFSSNRMLFYPTPNAAYTVEYSFKRPIYDFDTTTDNPDFPASFILPLKKLLAYELSQEYGTPAQERQELLTMGEKMWSDALAARAGKPSYVPLRTEYF